MNKYIRHTISVCLGIIIIFIGGCGNKALEEATSAVEDYNTQVAMFNEKVAVYNEAVSLHNKTNIELQDAVNEARDILNRGDVPYDSKTILLLEDALVSAEDVKADDLENIDEFASLSVDEEMEVEELKELTEKAIVGIAEIESLCFPDIPIPRNYSVELNNIKQSLESYLDSVQSLRQVTAPSDEFVISRLDTIESIIAIEAVTEEHDPNGMLNAPGGYIGCIYFYDSHVNQDNLQAFNAGDVIDIGTVGGGCIEVYSSSNDAENREVLLASYDDTIYPTGSHCVIGTCVVRISKELETEQQVELTNMIVEKLLFVQK